MTTVNVDENAPRCVFGLEERNAKAHKIISRYAKAHAAMDVGIGLMAFIPIPFAGTAALVAAILAQAPLIYTPMTKELAQLYASAPDEITTKMIADTVIEGASYDAAIDLGAGFLEEIASDLIGEAATGLAASAIPFIGPLLAAGLDATIAATLTWRVGTMVSAYFQNGESWIGSRKNTYKLASKAVGGFSPAVESRSDLNEFGRANPVISQKQLAFVMGLIDVARAFSGDRAQILSSLRGKKVPEWLVQEGIKLAFV
jgi:uncharacterized protein (DUF697 family)